MQQWPLYRMRYVLSVAWLCNFDGSEEAKQQVAADQQCGANVMIDITDELAKIVSLEAKFKCAKLEVERAVVFFCEGDLEKAEEVLKMQKQESTATASTAEGSSDSSGLANKQQLILAQNSARPQTNGFSSVEAQQTRIDEKDLNYNLLLNGGGPKEPAVKGFQPLATPIKPEMGRQQFVQPEKRRLNANSVPSVSYVTSSPLPVAVSRSQKHNGLSTFCHCSPWSPRIDWTHWSLDTTLLNPAAKSEWLSDTWSTMLMGGRSTRPSGNFGGAGISVA